MPTQVAERESHAAHCPPSEVGCYQLDCFLIAIWVFELFWAGYLLSKGTLTPSGCADRQGEHHLAQCRASQLIQTPFL